MEVEGVFTEALTSFKKNYVVLIIASAITVLGSSLVITAPPLIWGLFSMGAKVKMGEETKIEDVFQGFKNFVDSVVIFLVGGLAILIGLILLVIPGLLAAVLLQYALPLAVLKGEKPIDAITKSYELSRENLRFSLMLAFLLWVINAIGSSITVGWLITVPYSVLCLLVATSALGE